MAVYNYEQPVMKIVAIKDNLYIFEKEPLALEIVAQDEWERYDTRRKRMWESVKGFLKRRFVTTSPRSVH